MIFEPLFFKKKRFLVLISFFLIPSFIVSQGPHFQNIYSLDAEYELDRFMGNFPWQWRDKFRSQETAFQTTGTSLNIRHFYIRQQLKVRFPLIQKRLWFRVRSDKNKGLARDETNNLIEFEYLPVSHLLFSVLGEHTRHKSDTNFGVAARWGESENQSLKLFYLWPNFDTNKAFKNTSVNEGHQRFYRRFPQEAIIQSVWIKGPLSFYFLGRHRRPWEDHFRDFQNVNEQYVRHGSLSEASLDLRYTQRDWTLGIEGETWREKESIEFIPIRVTEDRNLIQERNMFRMAIQKKWSDRFQTRVGSGVASSRGNNRYPFSSQLSRGYILYDRISYIYFYNRLSPKFLLDWGYLYDRQWYKIRSGSVISMDSRSHNRGKLGCEYNWNNHSSIRFLAAIELDTNESETPVSFDGGTIQFQTSF